MDRRKQTHLPAGLRNNNAGNIRKTRIKWLGEVPEGTSTTNVHEQFRDSVYGLRALYKQIITTAKRTNLNPDLFVKDYAAGASPQVLQNYSNALALAISPHSHIVLNKDGILKIAKAIVKFENGNPANLITQAEYQNAWSLLDSTQTAETPSGKINPLAPILAVILLNAM